MDLAQGYLTNIKGGSKKGVRSMERLLLRLS